MQRLMELLRLEADAKAVVQNLNRAHSALLDELEVAEAAATRAAFDVQRELGRLRSEAEGAV